MTAKLRTIVLESSSLVDSQVRSLLIIIPAEEVMNLIRSFVYLHLNLYLQIIISFDFKIELIHSSQGIENTRGFKIGSFNFQSGLKNVRLDISICTLQETKTKDIIFLDH